MSRLPARLDDGDRGWLTTRQATKARRARERMELDVYRHGLRAMAEAECDRRDSQALADAATYAMDEELSLADYGMRRAGQSAVRIALVSSKLDLVSTVNNRRLVRRFGA